MNVRININNDVMDCKILECKICLDFIYRDRTLSDRKHLTEFNRKILHRKYILGMKTIDKFKTILYLLRYNLLTIIVEQLRCIKIEQ